MKSLNFYHPQERPWPNSLLTSTSIIGHTTSTSVRIWFRVSSPGDYLLFLSKNPLSNQRIPPTGNYDNSGNITSGNNPKTSSGENTTGPNIHRIKFTSDRDLTNVIELKHLEPNTKYYYSLFHNNKDKPWEMGHEEKLYFKTFPENDTEVNFGIYSGHSPYKERNLANVEMCDLFYQELSDTNSRFVIGMGNQVYADGNEHLSIWNWLRKVKHLKPTLDDMIAWYRDIYRGYWGLLPMCQILRNFANYSIWDDREILDNWGSYTAEELAAILDTSWQLRNSEENLRLISDMFKAAKTVYKEYQHSHNPATDDQEEQFDYEFNYSFCKFYVLDMRGHRDINRSSARVLGIAQWKRFQTWLNAQYDSSAKILFIVLSSPLVNLNNLLANKKLDLSHLSINDKLRDQWEHEVNYQERHQILDAVFNFSQTTKKQVIFLSGNVEIGSAFKLYNQIFPNARVFQLTSSPLTQPINFTGSRRIFPKIVVKEQINLLETKENIVYQFLNLYICRRNNFGIVRVKENEKGNVTVNYDLFSSNGQDDGVIEKKRIHLDQF